MVTYCFCLESRRYFSIYLLFICLTLVTLVESEKEEEKARFKFKMVLIDKLWDDVIAGPQPERGLGKLRKAGSLKVKTDGLLEGSSSSSSSKYQRSLSMSSSSGPGTPTTPGTPSTPSSAKKENVWRSVFHPGSNIATKGIGAALFDKPQPNSPTVYDWLYSGETRSKHR